MNALTCSVLPGIGSRFCEEAFCSSEDVVVVHIQIGQHHLLILTAQTDYIGNFCRQVNLILLKMVIIMGDL